MADLILLVEDDFALAMGTEYALVAEGYQVYKAETLNKAKIFLEKNKPDLMLLDVMMPDGNGFDFCKEIRERGERFPIIFLTAVGEEVNIVQGLSIGADDYVTKPYKVKELMSRIAANLRRYGYSKKITEKNSYTFGSHKFDFDKFKLFCKGETVDCTPSELRLLKELIYNKGQVLTRSQLMERIYDTENSFIDDNTLSVYMKRLRAKLSDDADYIETIRGVGYRFKEKT